LRRNVPTNFEHQAGVRTRQIVSLTRNAEKNPETADHRRQQQQQRIGPARPCDGAAADQARKKTRRGGEIGDDDHHAEQQHDGCRNRRRRIKPPGQGQYPWMPPSGLAPIKRRPQRGPTRKKGQAPIAITRYVAAKMTTAAVVTPPPISRANPLGGRRRVPAFRPRRQRSASSRRSVTAGRGRRAGPPARIPCRFPPGLCQCRRHVAAQFLHLRRDRTGPGHRRRDADWLRGADRRPELPPFLPVWRSQNSG